jgi:hypothetical protein
MPEPLKKHQGELGRLLALVTNLQQTPSSFKGLGTITLPGVRRARVAWAGLSPDRLRVEIFGVPGFPAASLAVNGSQAFLLQRNPPAYHRQDAGSLDLSRILTVPVTLDDLFRLLGGGIPARSYRDASLQERRGEGAGGPVLLFRRWLGTTAQTVAFDAETLRVTETAVFDIFGRLSYRILFSPPGRGPEVGVPVGGTAVTGDGRHFSLSVERFWRQAAVDPSAFVLEPPPTVSGGTP